VVLSPYITYEFKNN
jgi:hypothetical protein